MRIREREYRTCGECGLPHLERDEAFGCDTCQVTIGLASTTPMGHRGYLDLTVFPKSGDDTQKMQFCSWRCLLLKLPTIPCEYFINFPYLTYDEAEPGISAGDFLALLQPTLAALEAKRIVREAGK